MFRHDFEVQKLLLNMIFMFDLFEPINKLGFEFVNKNLHSIRDEDVEKKLE